MKQLQTQESADLRFVYKIGKLWSCKYESCTLVVYDHRVKSYSLVWRTVSEMRGCYVGSVSSTNTFSPAYVRARPNTLMANLKTGGGNALASRGLVPPPTDLEATEQRSSL